VLAVLTLTSLAILAVPETAGAEAGLHLWVDQTSSACSDAPDRLGASSAATPWCSLTRAFAVAEPGDTVHVRPGRYVGSVRAARSGRPDAPITFLAEGPGVVVDASGASAAVKLVSVSDIALVGLTVTGAALQGVWTDGSQRIAMHSLTVEHNQGHGVQIMASVSVSVSDSVIRANRGAGIVEGRGTSGGRYTDNQIVSNGVDDQPYNGDGIQLAGKGSYVGRNFIHGNGTPGPFEHGIYSGPASEGYVIEANVLSGNAGSNVKAAGSNGIIRYNLLDSGRLGLVVSDNAAPVLAYYNVIFGRYQHAVLVTRGETPAQARLWNNTIVVTGRQGSTGDASAIFVKEAGLLDLRNNLVSYLSADNLGRALYLLDASRVGTLVSDNNWFSTQDPGGRHLVRNGGRVTLKAWQKATGRDANSIASSPPRFDPTGRVTSRNLGSRLGQPVGLTRDYAGTVLLAGVPPDIGAYQGG
jgi:hypothetical protein